MTPGIHTPRFAKALAVLCAMTPGLLFTAGARAQAIAVQPRVSAGAQDYHLHFDDVILPLAGGGTDIRGGLKVDDRIEFVGAGLNFSVGRVFADLSGQWSQNGRDPTAQIEGNAIGHGVYTSGDGQNHSSDIRFNRQELNFTVGWGATPSLSVYGGYKYATVDLTQTLMPLLSPPPFVDFAGGRDGNVLFFGDYLMKFTYRGAFVGATYSVPVGLGALSLQSSLARLQGTFSQHFDGNVFVTNPSSTNLLRQIDPSFKDGQVAGNSFGLNVGISWTGNLAWMSGKLQSLIYTIGLDQSQYKFDSGRSKSLWAADLEEKNTRARLEIRYRFGGPAG